jgi:type I restriction-modification system DNA methylase subunit
MMLVRRFSEEEDRDAGEFYHPAVVIDMVVRILAPFEDGDSVYDPTAGAGDMLVGVASHYRDVGGDPNKLTFVGQESIKGMTEAANLNFLLNDVEAEIEDLFDNEFYYNTVISAYEDVFDQEQQDRLEMDEIPETSIAKKFTDHFDEQGLGGFDKTRVAKEIRSITEQDDCDDERVGEATIENFRAVFEEINTTFV